jgi:hypothetical protein
MGKISNEYVVPDIVTDIGNCAFFSCTRLMSITISNNVKSIGDSAFMHCRYLVSITISSGVTTISPYAFFDCNKLASIIIPNNVTSIEKSAFSGCSHLTSITLPKSLKKIISEAFYFCSNLTLITDLNPVPIDAMGSGYSIFMGIKQSTCTLKVPTGSVEAYQNAEVWKKFNIIGGGFLVNPVTSNLEYGYTIGDALYEANETAIVSATAYNGYKFINWTKDGEEVSTDNPYSFIVTEDVELVANFEEDVEIYSVTVSVNNEESGTATGNGEYEANETAIVTAAAFSGYKFVNWTKDGVEVSIDNPYSFSVTEDMELVANFEEILTIDGLENPIVNIYPNPTTSELHIFHISNLISHIEIYDVYGRKHERAKGRKGEGANEIVMDISELQAGIYFVQVTTENGVITKKVVKY